MALIKEFLTEIDAKWKPIGEEPITLQIIGSAALMLQCDYDRGTKDMDVLEAKDGSPAVKEGLLAMEVSYLKTSRGAKTPDFLVKEAGEDIVVEVAGKGKGRSRFKGMKAGRKLILSHSDSLAGHRRPLFLLGFA